MPFQTLVSVERFGVSLRDVPTVELTRELGRRGFNSTPRAPTRLREVRPLASLDDFDDGPVCERPPPIDRFGRITERGGGGRAPKTREQLDDGRAL